MPEEQRASIDQLFIFTEPWHVVLVATQEAMSRLVVGTMKGVIGL